MPNSKKKRIIEVIPSILKNTRGAIIDMQRPMHINDAGLVDGNKTKQAVNTATTICNTRHICREANEMESRSLRYMSEVHTCTNTTEPSIMRRGMLR